MPLPQLLRTVMQWTVQTSSNMSVISQRGVAQANDSQFGMRHDEWLIKENIASLRQLMSDQNLQLLPDYGQRINVLKDLGFIDEYSRVELKGKVACEVRS